LAVVAGNIVDDLDVTIVSVSVFMLVSSMVTEVRLEL
jgi:hypothetical protein